MAPAWVPSLFSFFWTSNMSLLFFLSFFPSPFAPSGAISSLLSIRCGFQFVWWSLLAEYPRRHVAVCDTLCWFCMYKILFRIPRARTSFWNPLKNANVLAWNRSWRVKDSRKKPLCRETQNCGNGARKCSRLHLFFWQMFFIQSTTQIRQNTIQAYSWGLRVLLKRPIVIVWLNSDLNLHRAENQIGWFFFFFPFLSLHYMLLNCSISLVVHGVDKTSLLGDWHLYRAL